MASDVKVWTGSAWESIKGADGAPGPTVVSADAGNVAKLGADGRISVQPADMDSRWVNVTGDTMTGQLAVERDGLTGASGIMINAYADSGNSVLTLRKTRGTKAAQTALVNGDFVGRLNFSTITTTGTAQTANFNCLVRGTPTSSGAETYFTLAVTKPDGTQVVPATFDQAGIQTAYTVQAANVTATGATKTVALEVSSAATFSDRIIHNVTAGIGHTMTLTSPSATSQATGLVVNIQPVASQTSCGVRITNPGAATGENIGLFIGDIPADADNYSIYDGSPASNFFRGNCGINWANPTANLEVQGTARVRGTLEVTGNITSAGTAHSFAAASIPASAVGGTFGALTATTVSATGGRSNFAPLSEPYAIGLRYNAAGLPNYIGTTATGEFQVSSAGGVSLLRIDETTGNITSPGTSHSFAAGSIPASAISGLSAATGTFTTPITVGNGRSAFTAASESYAISLKYNAAGTPTYIGTGSTGDFEVSSSGGVEMFSVNPNVATFPSKGTFGSQLTAQSFKFGFLRAIAQGTPSTAQDIGQMWCDGDYIYIATSVNTWKRVALSAY